MKAPVAAPGAPVVAPTVAPVWSAQAPNLLVFTFLEDDSHRLVQQLERQLGPRTCGNFESAQWDGASRIVVVEHKTRVKNSVILVIEPTAAATGGCDKPETGIVHVPPDAWALVR